MIATFAAGCGSSDDPTKNMSEEEKAAWEAVVNDPYGKYPELITYTSGYNLTNQGGDTLAGTRYAFGQRLHPLREGSTQRPERKHV